jgi:hypothetical protein
MSADNNTESRFCRYLPRDNEILLLQDCYLRHEFTFKSDKDNHEEYASTNFRIDYCHSVDCEVKPFYVGREIYYEYKHNNDETIPHKKYFLYKFVLLTDLEKEDVPDERAIVLFEEYLLKAALLDWK